MSESPGDLRIWQLALDASAEDLARLGRFLSRGERERASRLQFERDRDRFVAGRGQLREVLGELLELPPEVVRFTYGLQGKPALAYDHDSEIRFNLSHSENLALLAVTSGREIGVDLEFIRDDINPLELAPSAFSPEECDSLAQLPESERLLAFYGYWTRKEAFIKALGLGFTRETKTFTLTLEEEQSIEGCTITPLDAPIGFIAALAVEISP